ncbi:hypothetical protein ACFOPX_01815 [Helicobacter baculiformis]|uniref:Uncharacterized protein n=1 Tax=Helicobacter baculiformis TaxID=427351 RepID=A0ABV7ZFD1_9HELI|nr:hypothetical protein [Helicobacter baculiformis]
MAVLKVLKGAVVGVRALAAMTPLAGAALAAGAVATAVASSKKS